MIVLDVIAAYYLPSFSAWIFLLFVLTAESLLLSKFLSKNWYDRKIFVSVIASNLLTTILGFFLFDDTHSGGHLFNWIPLFNYYGDIMIADTIHVFKVSFVITLIVETPINLLRLKNDYNKMRIIIGTLIVNCTTYAVGGLIISIYKYYNY